MENTEAKLRALLELVDLTVDYKRNDVEIRFNENSGGPTVNWSGGMFVPQSLLESDNALEELQALVTAEAISRFGKALSEMIDKGFVGSPCLGIFVGKPVILYVPQLPKLAMVYQDPATPGYKVFFVGCIEWLQELKVEVAA